MELMPVLGFSVAFDNFPARSQEAHPLVSWYIRFLLGTFGFSASFRKKA